MMFSVKMDSQALTARSAAERKIFPKKKCYTVTLVTRFLTNLIGEEQKTHFFMFSRVREKMRF